MSARAPDPLPDSPVCCFDCGRRTPPEDIGDYLPTTSGTEPLCEECYTEILAGGDAE